MDDPYQRMLYIAAFSVSSYAATVYRAGQKPFNPLLGETFECIREDKGWRFIAEQVSWVVESCIAEQVSWIFVVRFIAEQVSCNGLWVTPCCYISLYFLFSPYNFTYNIPYVKRHIIYICLFLHLITFIHKELQLYL